ncbi:TolC family protein [Sphingobacterium rhinopitheci]|uniref:TolC family protein n=1 Tax=Sphingobacterium rhinopitheci TaxID=2781960 RepID=UPI001F51586C|nr:TolC family protein [Sphingobacterium rhinopitheci]MCI0920540.1 TolC family protein [Sphingobacterium rhinopitheci]
MYNFTKSLIKHFLLVYLILIPAVLLAQEDRNGIPDLGEVQLPPLETLFENAKNNPGVEMLKSRLESQELLLTTEQRSWLKYFKVGGSYQYGNISLNSAFTNEYTPLFFQSTGQVQNTWYGTAGVNIPLDDIFDRKNKIKRVKLEGKISELEMKNFHDQLCISISESYMKVKLFTSTLHKRVEEYSIANGNFQMVEGHFKIGSSTVSELNIAKKQETEAFERLRANEFDMLNELFKLEILSSTKIISK